MFIHWHATHLFQHYRKMHLLRNHKRSLAVTNSSYSAYVMYQHDHSIVRATSALRYRLYSASDINFLVNCNDHTVAVKHNPNNAKAVFVRPLG